jgi:hypothetical protein
MHDLYPIIGKILFASILVFAVSRFLYIMNALKNNILLSDAVISQWAFSVILSLIFIFSNLDKIFLICAIPFSYILSFTYLGSFISFITMSLLNIFVKKGQ